MSVLERWSARARLRPLAVDVVLAVALSPLAVWTMFMLFAEKSEARQVGSIATQHSWPVLIGFVVLLAHVAVVIRRTHPAYCLTLVGLATGAQLLASIWLVLPSTLVFLVSLYSFCAYERRSAPVTGLLVGAVGVVVVTVAGFALLGRAANVGELLLHSLARLLPFVIAAWSLGMFQRIRVTYVAALEERATRAEEEREERARRAVTDERTRIAREMHDVISHALSVILSQAQGGRYAARTDPSRAVEALGTIAESGRQALADMRGLLEVLRTGEGPQEDRLPPPTLSELPHLLGRVREVGVRVSFEEQGTPRPLSPVGELAVFRLVQEALTNIIKHAGPDVTAVVRFAWATDELSIIVTDNGHGSRFAGDGQGIVGMRERFAVVGGTVATGPAADGGFRVRASLPVRAKAWV